MYNRKPTRFEGVELEGTTDEQGLNLFWKKRLLPDKPFISAKCRVSENKRHPPGQRAECK